MALTGVAPDESELLNKINDLIQRLKAKIAELGDVISRNIGRLSSYLQQKVREGWSRFTTTMQSFWDFLAEVLRNMGSPWRLWATADAWSNQIGGPVSATVAQVDAGSLAVDDDWSGTAANQYRQVLPMQKAALDKVKTSLADGASAALSDVATRIVTFWGALAVALAACVAGLITALASTATLLGLPAGPFIAAAAGASAGTAADVGAAILLAGCQAANTTLRQKLNDNTAYPNGNWPPAHVGS